MNFVYSMLLDELDFSFACTCGMHRCMVQPFVANINGHTLHYIDSIGRYAKFNA